MENVREFSRVAVLASAIGALLSVACGSKKGSPDFSSGIEPTKPLAEVTQAEARRSCESLSREVDRRMGSSTMARIGCVALALEIAPAVSLCEELASQCQQAVPPGGFDEFLIRVECDGDTSSMSDCSASVGLYDTCVRDTFEEFELIKAEIHCGHAPQIAAGASPEELFSIEPAEPASCAELAAACPTVSEDAVLGGRIIYPDIFDSGEFDWED